MRTRVKICGLTREADVDAVVQAGADAVGFVLYAPSPRAVTVEHAAELARRLPAFVTPVLLFVNADDALLEAAAQAIPHATWQFHGDETPERCDAVTHHGRRAYLRAARIPLVPADGAPPFDLLEFRQRYSHAQAILLDAQVEGYGGGGKVFDWTLIPPDFAKPLILSGGLDAGNVVDAIARVRPAAVDVSSGVEAARGIKDAEKIREFVSAVRSAGLMPID